MYIFRQLNRSVCHIHAVKMFFAFLSILLAVIGPNVLCSERTGSDILRQVLSTQEYNKRARPLNGMKDAPTEVQVGFYVEHIASVSELDMEFTISIYLRQEWRDNRLAHNETTQKVWVDAAFIDEIWLPSLYFVNGKDEKRHTIPVPNTLMILSPDGTVFHSEKLSLRLYCGMHLRKFPFDKQSCSVKMMSYAYNTNGILLQWLNGENSVEIKPDVELPEFEVHDKTLLNCTEEYIAGAFSCLEGKIFLMRRYMHYAIQLYVPSALIVMLSWANFWIDHRSTPARVSLALLCILTITTQSSGISSELPKVSYLKAIDVWMSVCLVFVFSAFVEFTLVNIMARREEGKSVKKVEDAVATVSMDTLDVTQAYAQHRDRSDSKRSMLSASANRFLNRQQAYLNNTIIPPLTLDKTSRIAFPLLFIVFNTVYWLVYLVHYID